MAYVSTDTTRRVRAELKQAYPNLKFSVSKKDGTLRVRIMSGDIDFRDVWEDIPQSKQYWKRYGNPKPHFEGYVDINTYHPDSYNPKYTDLFKGIIDIMKGDEWFDKSEPQIDYFNTAYYMKLSVGKWNKDYQYTGVPRMSDLFGRMRAEDYTDPCPECEAGTMYSLCDKCGYEYKSLGTTHGESCPECKDGTVYAQCDECGYEYEWMAESFDADFQKMINMDKGWVKCHPCNFTWHNSVRKECLLCGNEPVNNDAEKLLNSEEEDKLRLWRFNNYFEEEVYRLSPDIYAEVFDKIDYNYKQLKEAYTNPSYYFSMKGSQDRIKQFQNRVRRIDENIYQRAMETAQMRIAKEEEDLGAETFEAQTKPAYKRFMETLEDVFYNPNSLIYGMGEDKLDYQDVRKLYHIQESAYANIPSFQKSPIKSKSIQENFNNSFTDAELDFDEFRAHRQAIRKYGTKNERGDLRTARKGIIDYNGNKYIYEKPIYTDDHESFHFSKLESEDFEAEGEDITLKDSAKLGFGLGAGLLGFRVALFGASALVGGLLLNRNK